MKTLVRVAWASIAGIALLVGACGKETASLGTAEVGGAAGTASPPRVERASLTENVGSMFSSRTKAEVREGMVGPDGVVTTRSVAVADPAEMKGLLDAVGADQVPGAAAAAGCAGGGPPALVVAFFDAGGVLLGSVVICGGAEAAGMAGFLIPRVVAGAWFGVRIADPAAIRAVLARHASEATTSIGK